MGWKSTLTLSREKALSIIVSSLFKLTNEELESVLYPFGDYPWSDVYGHNFRIIDHVPEEERSFYE